jgi:uncharacterized protein YegL
MSQISFDEQIQFPNEFIMNPENRCPCILVLDTSGSMSGEPINELNSGLQQFARELAADSLASKRVECAIVTFGDSVELACDFVTADRFVAPILSASGATPMGEAINMALDKIAERKQTYKQNGISYFRPWLLLMSDGEPTDASIWPTAAVRAKQEQTKKSLILHSIGVGSANLARLGEFSVSPAMRLQGLKFSEFFRWLSASLGARSRSQPGQAISLEDPTKTWGSLEG